MFFFLKDNAVYTITLGVVNQVTDSSGNYIYNSSNGIYFSHGECNGLYKVNTNGVAFVCDIVSDGRKTGYHTIKYFEIDTQSVEDIFDNVPSNIEILDIAVSDSDVYFTGVRGMSNITGKVNIETKLYTPINTNQRLSSIAAVKF